MEFGLLGAALIAAASMRLVLWFQAGIGDDPPNNIAWEAAIVSGIIGLGVGRVGAMVAGGVNPISHPLDLLIVRGGVDTVLASIAAVAAFAVVARHDLVATADAVAAAAAAGLAGWHAGCLTRSACLGSATDLPWAMSGPSGIGRHPVELYAALLFALATGAILLLRVRRIRPGVAAGLAVTAAGGVRWGTEPMRLSIGGDPTWWYAVVAATGAVIVATAWMTGRRRT